MEGSYRINGTKLVWDFKREVFVKKLKKLKNRKSCLYNTLKGTGLRKWKSSVLWI